MTDMIDVGWSAVATLAPIRSVGHEYFWPMFVYIGLHAEMSLIATSGLLPLRNKWCVHTKTIHRPFPTHKLLLIMEVCVLWLCDLWTHFNKCKPSQAWFSEDKQGREDRKSLHFFWMHLQMHNLPFTTFIGRFLYFSSSFHLLLLFLIIAGPIIHIAAAMVFFFPWVNWCHFDAFFSNTEKEFVLLIMISLY